jgi:hypothetical protein
MEAILKIFIVLAHQSKHLSGSDDAAARDSSGMPELESQTICRFSTQLICPVMPI